MEMLRLLNFINLFFILLPVNLFADEKVRIGVSAPLTSEASVFGNDIKSVLQFAKQYFHDDHIELIFEDDKCSGKEGANVSHSFVQRKVSAVIGYACVESIMPAIPILEAAKIPVISVLASGPDVTSSGDGIFNLYPSDSEGVKIIADRISELQLENVLVLSASSAFSLGISQAFEKYAKEINAFNTKLIEYPPGTSDFRSLLLKNLKKENQAIFVNYISVSEFTALMQQIKELKISTKVFTSYLNGFEAIKKANNLALIEGVEFYDTAPLKLILKGKDNQIFKKFIQEKGNLQSSNAYFPFIFNGYVALRESLSKSSDLETVLKKDIFLNGIGGKFQFDEDGNVQGGPSFVLKKLQSGEVTNLS